MDPEQYLRIFTYLQKNTLPTDLTNNTQINRFKNFCKPFIIKNNYLYRKDRKKEENHLRVIRRFEMEPVLYIVKGQTRYVEMTLTMNRSQGYSRYGSVPIKQDTQIREFIWEDNVLLI